MGIHDFRPPTLKDVRKVDGLERSPQRSVAAGAVTLYALSERTVNVQVAIQCRVYSTCTVIKQTNQGF